MFFLALSNANFEFGNEKLTWRYYIITEALSTINQVKLIDKTEFTRAALNGNSKTFVVYVATFKVPTTMLIHLFRASQV